VTIRPVRIDRLLPSANLWNNKRGRFASQTYSKERDAWMILLRCALPIRNRAPQIHVRMRITSYRRSILDYGNLVAGAKPIPDCLKYLGYIYDDAPKWFTCAYEQFQAPEALRGTVLEFLT